MRKITNLLYSACSALLIGSVATLAIPSVTYAGEDGNDLKVLRAGLDNVSTAAINTKYLKMLKEKLDEVEKNQAELYHSLEEKKRAGLKGKITDRVTFGGIIEVEASADSNDKTGDTSDIVLATASLGFGAEINERVSSNIVLLYEEDATPLTVDEASVTALLHPDLSVTAGMFYLPFGVYNSHLITDPITLSLGEINESAIMATYSNKNASFEFSAGLFNGAMDKTGDADKIDDFIVSFTARPIDGLTIGAYYLSDFAETARMESLVPARTETVAGQGAFFSYEARKFVLEGEYITASGRYRVADLDKNSDGTGDRPGAFNIELGYHYNAGTEIAIRYEASTDFFDWPKRQYGVAVGYGIYENVALAFELLHGEYESSDVKRTVASTQLAIEF